MTVYLRIALYTAGEQPTYQFNLRDCIERSMESVCDDEDDQEGFKRISIALRALADDMDLAIKNQCPLSEL